MPTAAMPRIDDRGDRQGRRQDRRRDGSADRRLGRLPYHLRHVQGGRSRHAHHRYLPRREIRRQVRPLHADQIDGLLPVDEAKARILTGVKPLAAETVQARSARWAACSRAIVKATRDQPPFAASAMDGYAVRAADVAARPGATQSHRHCAGRSCLRRQVGAGEAVRIFTGAPMPSGADTVVIQENTEADGDDVIVSKAPVPGPFGARQRPRFPQGRNAARRPARVLDASRRSASPPR